jgi:putative transposase
MMMKKTRRTPQQWQQLVSDWQHSGQTVAEFCQSHPITPSNFYLWRKRLDTDVTETALPPWIALSSSAATDVVNANDWQLELSLPGGVILRMKQGQ